MQYDIKVFACDLKYTFLQVMECKICLFINIIRHNSSHLVFHINLFKFLTQTQSLDLGPTFFLNFVTLV